MRSSAGRFRIGNRLKRREEFKQVFSSKNRSGDNCFLFLAKRNSLDRSRLGLVVPKKHINSAVKRNQLKRIIRESFRLEQKKLNGKDIVVIVRNKLDTRKKNIKSIIIKYWDKLS